MADVICEVTRPDGRLRHESSDYVFIPQTPEGVAFFRQHYAKVLDMDINIGTEMPVIPWFAHVMVKEGLERAKLSCTMNDETVDDDEDEDESEEEGMSLEEQHDLGVCPDDCELCAEVEELHDV